MPSLLQYNSKVIELTPERKQTLAPLDKPPQAFTLGAFDIEGVGGPNGFLVGGVMLGDDYDLHYNPRSMIELFKTRKYAKVRFAAHNLTYDYALLEPYLNEDDFPLLLNGRVFKASLYRDKRNPRYLIDSLLFAGGLPLAKVGESIGLLKLDTPESVLAFNPKMSQANRIALLGQANVLDYLYRDVEIVQKYMTLFQTTINELGGEMKFTLASTAMDLFKRRFLSAEYLTPFQARNDFARHAYYGGRVEPYRVGLTKNVNVYDINSQYPYVMRNKPFPNPNTLIGPISNPPKNLIFTYEGVSDVTIYVPKAHIPPLPYRANDKLYFPYGVMRGSYTHVELRKACELGAKLLTVHNSLYSQDTCSPFVNYVDTLYAKRQELKSAHNPSELVLKILLNSLYGKFGQRLSAGLQTIRSILWWLDGHTSISCDFREIDGQVWVVVDKETPGQPNYINVLWASYISAYARLELLNYMLIADENLVYADTDSLFVKGEFPTSAELGALKLEYENVDVEVYAPKAYILLDGDMVITEKCKGVPASERLRFLLEGQASFERPTGLLEAGRLRGKPNGQPFYPAEWRKVTKQQRFEHPKRLLLVPEFLEGFASPTQALRSELL